MSEEKSQEKNQLFRAELKDTNGKKDISIVIGTSHLPYLCYALKLLEMQIENAMIANQASKEVKPVIASPNDIGLLKKLLKR